MKLDEIPDVTTFGPRTVRRIHHELLLLLTATELLIKDNSVSAEVRGKIEQINDHILDVEHIAWLFLYETNGCSFVTSNLTVLDVREEFSSWVSTLWGEEKQLQIALESDLWPIKADSDQFRDMLFKLVANAREAMPNGGNPRIRVGNIAKAQCEATPETKSIAGDYVLIEVADTGVGIPQSDVDRIFDPFFSTKGPDRGFGLAKVYRTVKEINGHIIVESEVGKGTTFRIFLPRAV